MIRCLLHNQWAGSAAQKSPQGLGCRDYGGEAATPDRCVARRSLFETVARRPLCNDLVFSCLLLASVIRQAANREPSSQAHAPCCCAGLRIPDGMLGPTYTQTVLLPAQY